MTIGAQLLSMHYQQILDTAHQVPAAILFGKIQCGKSRAQECAASLLGIRDSAIISQTTSDLVFADMSSRSTLGFGLDDPSSVSILSEKILNHFEGIQVISSSKQYKPTESDLKAKAKEMRSNPAYSSVPLDSLLGAAETKLKKDWYNQQNEKIKSRLYKSNRVKANVNSWIRKSD